LGLQGSEVRNGEGTVFYKELKMVVCREVIMGSQPHPLGRRRYFSLYQKKEGGGQGSVRERI